MFSLRGLWGLSVYEEAYVKERDQQHQIFVQFLLGEADGIRCKKED